MSILQNKIIPVYQINVNVYVVYVHIEANSIGFTANEKMKSFSKEKKKKHFISWTKMFMLAHIFADSFNKMQIVHTGCAV